MVCVLFVCLGNICRSPSAEGVFRAHAERDGFNNIFIDSAGTGDWHIGHAPDKRAVEAAKKRNVDIGGLRARLVTPDDFAKFDYIVAMDSSNLAALKTMAPRDFKGEMKLLMDYAPSNIGYPEDVPDPYYGGGDGFEHVLDMIEQASDGLLEHIKVRAGKA